MLIAALLLDRHTAAGRDEERTKEPGTVTPGDSPLLPFTESLSPYVEVLSLQLVEQGAQAVRVPQPEDMRAEVLAPGHTGILLIGWKPERTIKSRPFRVRHYLTVKIIGHTRSGQRRHARVEPAVIDIVGKRDEIFIRFVQIRDTNNDHTVGNDTRLRPSNVHTTYPP